MSNSLDTDQDRQNVGPDLGPNCLQRLLADNKKKVAASKERVALNIQICACLRGRSGSVVECLTRDRRAAGSSLTGVTALWSLSKTHLS